MGAFDNAWHPGILSCLRKLKCPLNIGSILSGFLGNRVAQVKIGNSVSSKPLTKGLPQGSVSGPTLWNTIISYIIERLTVTPNTETVIFADDILVMIHGISHPAILTTLQKTFKPIEEWCAEPRLEISKDRSALMPMLIRNREDYKNNPITASWGLNIVSKMRHLGIMLDSKLEWYPHTQLLESKTLRIRNNLARCSRASW